MDQIIRGNLQVVEADIEPLFEANIEPVFDTETTGEYDTGIMMGQEQGHEPLQDSSPEKHYGATQEVPGSRPRDWDDMDGLVSGMRAGGSGGRCNVDIDGDFNGKEEEDEDKETSERRTSLDGKSAETVRDADGIASFQDSNGGSPEDNDGPESSSGITTVKIADGVGADRSRCGWCGFAPNVLQVFNSPRGYLFCTCWLALLQGMTAFGLVYISITALEHRFNLDSFQSSFISSSYDFSALSVSIFVTYLGEQGHKPRWIGCGSMLFSLGSIIFALPHFLTPPYQVGGAGEQVCHRPEPNETVLSLGCDDGAPDSSLQMFYWVFIFAQVLHGLGGSPLYTLGVTYMDENMHANDFGLYLGIFNAINAAGPALGYILGGVYLKLYTDFDITDSVPVSPSNPTWVGAWWLGFLLNGTLLFLMSALMMGYPRSLPGAKKIAKERKSEVQRGKEFETGKGFRKRLRAFPQAVLNLLTNVPLMCLNFFTVCEWLFAAGLSVFGPKYLESQMNMSSSTAAFYSGLLTMGGTVVGALVGGWVIQKLDLRFKGLVGFGIVCVVACLASSCVFLLKCPNVPMAGVTVSYKNSSAPVNSGTNISAACNAACDCGSGYDPVCGSDDVLYYSACYAGCSRESGEGDDVVYENCTCIEGESGSGQGTATSGKCPVFCSSTRPALVILFLFLAFGGMVLVPIWTATIRCVPHSQRTFALGLQSLMYSALGTVPSPIIVGFFIDKSCLVWEEGCDGSKTCWLYQNADLARVFLLLALLSNAAALLFLLGALFSYKTPSRKGRGGEGGYDRLETQDETDGV
ncbi:solute carrier organic anion transporter family member 4A1-like [Diadema antillarum]|uniref:solute carrier organic anion transporter family member 4A1-like n=1 Tax=Diadema antillarum TaxID=105358 RepID=UPI003A8BAB12